MLRLPTLFGVFALALAAAPAAAQNGDGLKAPFGPGERAEYAVGYGPIPAGSMTLAVVDRVTFEGRPAYHLRMTAKSNQAVSFVFELSANEESWLDAERFESLRYRRRNVEDDEVRTKDVRFDHERGVRIVREDGETKTRPTSPGAVDPVSTLFYLRLLPLEPGTRFTLENQADPADNPVVVKVLKRERIKVPAGSFDALLLDVAVETDSGIFKKGGENRLWVTADERRLPIRISSKVGLGSFKAELLEYARGR